MEALETALLTALATVEVVYSPDFAATQGVEHQAVVGVMKSLEAESYVACEMKQTDKYDLTPEAVGYLSKGSPEMQLLSGLPNEGWTDAEMEAALGKELAAVGKGKAMKNKWVSRDKASGKYLKSVSGLPQEKKEGMRGSEGWTGPERGSWWCSMRGRQRAALHDSVGNGWGSGLLCVSAEVLTSWSLCPSLLLCAGG